MPSVASDHHGHGRIWYIRNAAFRELIWVWKPGTHAEWNLKTHAEGNLKTQAEGKLKTRAEGN